MTVDQLTARFPQAIEVLNRFGIDMCCGGGVSLKEATERDGASLDQVQRALVEVLERAAAERDA
jgi:iron-sulfur cluster repair protein YtfE (RIC family)